MPNGIDLILADHELVASLFDAFESTGDAGLSARSSTSSPPTTTPSSGALYPLAAIVLDDADAARPLARSPTRPSSARSTTSRPRRARRSSRPSPCSAALVEEHVADEEKHLLPALRERGHRPTARRARRPDPPGQAASRLTRVGRGPRWVGAGMLSWLTRRLGLSDRTLDWAGETLIDEAVDRPDEPQPSCSPRPRDAPAPGPRARGPAC